MPSLYKAKMGGRLAHTIRKFLSKISDRESVLFRSAVISNRFDRKGMVPGHIPKSKTYQDLA